MRLVVAIVECRPHEATAAAEFVRTAWAGATAGNLLEHVHAVSTDTTWRICFYTRLRDRASAEAAADELVRRTLASITTVERWNVLSVATAL